MKKTVKKYVESTSFHASNLSSLNNDVKNFLQDKMNSYRHVKITNSDFKVIKDEYDNEDFYKDIAIEMWNDNKEGLI